MLTDSGFVNVFNINGGVSNLHLSGLKGECDLLASDLPYKIVSPQTLADKNGPDYFILDVRPDSSFRGLAIQERKNALGKFSAAVNIPLAILEQNIASVPKNKKLLIVDETGNESVMAAQLLHKNGYADLAILFNGLEAYLAEVPEKQREGWINPVAYHTINPAGFHELMKKNNATVVDIRTTNEFNNSSPESFRNVGYIKGAINIPFTEWDKHTGSLPPNKETHIVLYSFSTTPELFEAAKKIAGQGYTNVHVILGGLYSFRWRAANIKGHEHLKDWVVNVPPDNQ